MVESEGLEFCIRLIISGSASETPENKQNNNILMGV